MGKKQEFIQCCPLVKGKHSTQNKAKGHRGLPENPVELREAFNFPNKLCNWIQVEQCPAASSSVYANERTDPASKHCYNGFLSHFLSLPFILEWENTHLGLDSHSPQIPLYRGFISKSRTSAQGWDTSLSILCHCPVTFGSSPHRLSPSHSPVEGQWDRWVENLGSHWQEMDKHAARSQMLRPHSVSSC